MKHSIYIRNFYMTAGIVFLSFLILGSMFFLWSYRLVINQKQEAMYETACETTRFISAYDQEWALGGLEMRLMITLISNSSGYHILVANTDGFIVSSSDKAVVSEYIGKSIPNKILSQVAPGCSFSKNTDLGGLYKELRYVMGVPLTSGTDSTTVGYVFLSSRTGEIYMIWRQFAAVFLLISVSVLFLTFVISFITTKRQAEPLKEMSLAARRFARGDFSVRVEDTGRVDEIGQLTDAFNMMADSLERSENLRRDFIANVSHELKTPMTVISGFSDGILDGTVPTVQERKYLEVISSETKRLSRLVRNMLDMSRIQSTSTETLLSGQFDISEVIRLTLLGLGGKIEVKDLDVGAELPEEPIITRGEKDSITQVVYNLIDNAIKFAEEGSTIRISLWKQGMKAYISVENQGETIPADEMPLIFDRFHKTDRSRSENRDGTGLGLYIVKTILDNHNEDIFVASSEGHTTFTFTLTVISQKNISGS